MRATTITVGPLAAASANNIALSQSPAGAFTLNGSTGGVLDTARQVLITNASNEGTRTVTLVGTDVNGSVLTDVVTLGAAATYPSHLSFATVTSATISAQAAGNITIGTNAIAASRWMRLDEYAPAAVTAITTVTGTVNYTLQQCSQDPNNLANPVLPYQMVWQNSLDPNAVGSAISQVTYFPNAPLWVRILLNSGSGSVSMVVNQNGMVPY